MQSKLLNVYEKNFDVDFIFKFHAKIYYAVVNFNVEVGI